ncbi:hypothetical protein BX070DRAFT_230866 [Coemansia spiralis]|nr:hypothetical protein BX070DRAFT_230866 [Coemansia spiralis]
MGGGGKHKKTSDRSLLDISENDDKSMPELPSFLLGKGFSDKANIELDPTITSDSSASKRTFHVEPPSALLSRLQAFLPQIAEANSKLKDDIANDPNKLDIENVSDSEEQYIEMDLGLGVFDMKPKKDTQKAGNIIIGSKTDANSSTESDSEGDDMDDKTQYGKGKEPKIVLDPNSAAKRTRRKPHIEVLGTFNMPSDSDDLMGEGSNSKPDFDSDSDLDSNSLSDQPMNE